MEGCRTEIPRTYPMCRYFLLKQIKTLKGEEPRSPKELTFHTPYFFRRRQWHPTPVLLPGKSHGQRSLVGCSPWGRWELDTTLWLHFHFSLSCIGEGNGNLFQCSCPENPGDGGAWWAAVYGVAQSQTRLKRLSSSSRRSCLTGSWLHGSEPLVKKLGLETQIRGFGRLVKSDGVGLMV